MTHLKLTLEKALSTYKNGDTETKKLLIDLYGSEHFITDIKDRVTSYEAACKILNRAACTIDDFSFLGPQQAKKQFSRHKISTGIEAINEGWEADFDNENQRKYYNWFYNHNKGFASRTVFFSFAGCVGAGSDFHIENEEKAKIIARVFKEDYIVYLF